jgi:hypothetical protein
VVEIYLAVIGEFSMRIAIVHHWFVTQGGGERVAEVIGNIFPDADLFTLVADPWFRKDWPAGA